MKTQGNIIIILDELKDISTGIKGDTTTNAPDTPNFDNVVQALEKIKNGEIAGTIYGDEWIWGILKTDRKISIKGINMFSDKPGIQIVWNYGG